MTRKSVLAAGAAAAGAVIVAAGIAALPRSPRPSREVQVDADPEYPPQRDSYLDELVAAAELAGGAKA